MSANLIAVIFCNIVVITGTGYCSLIRPISSSVQVLYGGFFSRVMLVLCTYCYVLYRYAVLLLSSVAN